MKSNFLKCMVLALVVTTAACNNDTEKEQSKPTPAETTPPPQEKTEVSVGPGGAEVKTKDARVKITTKDTLK